MSLLGTGADQNAGRYRHLPSRDSGANAVCQRCLQKGHWTYQCKNPQAYKARPTRTQQLLNPRAKPHYMDASELPPELQDEPNRKPRDGNTRKAKLDSSSSSDSSTSSSSSSTSSSSSDGSSSGTTSSGTSTTSASDSDASSRSRSSNSRTTSTTTSKYSRDSSPSSSSSTSSSGTSSTSSTSSSGTSSSSSSSLSSGSDSDTTTTPSASRRRRSPSAKRQQRATKRARSESEPDSRSGPRVPGSRREQSGPKALECRTPQDFGSKSVSPRGAARRDRAAQEYYREPRREASRRRHDSESPRNDSEHKRWKME